MGPPEEVRGLADRRAQARAARDFATADALRAEIEALGWSVRDAPDGYALDPRPAYHVHHDLAALPTPVAATARRASVALLVEGWADDLRRCVDALLTHAPSDVVVVGLDVGNVDGSGDALHLLADANPGRVEEWHVATSPGWGEARSALLQLDPAEVHVVMETSTLLEGDALSPLLTVLAEQQATGVVAAGWRGADVDLDQQWRSFEDAGPGEVDALLGYLLAVRRDAALAAGGFDPRALTYRNADLEFSLALRERGGRLVVPDGELPVRQDRHRGFHDSDQDWLARESRRTYDRLLARFRGRDELLAPRP